VTQKKAAVKPSKTDPGPYAGLWENRKTGSRVVVDRRIFRPSGAAWGVLVSSPALLVPDSRVFAMISYLELDEKYRRVESKPDRHPSRDEWLCGYAAALGAVRRLYHHDSAVAGVLVADGLTVAHLLAAGVEKFDLDPIKAATGWPRGT